MCIISVSASCRRKIQSRRSKPELCRSRTPEMHNLGGNGFARELMLNEHNLLRIVLDRFDGLCLLADNRFALTSQSNLSISQIGNGSRDLSPASAGSTAQIRRQVARLLYIRLRRACSTSSRLSAPQTRVTAAYRRTPPRDHARSKIQSQPGTLRGLRSLIGLDKVLLEEREFDLVEAVQQALSRKLGYLETIGLFVGSGDGLFPKIDRDLRARKLREELQEFVDPLRAKPNGQHAVLEHVVIEDVGEGRRDHATDAKIQQRPRRMLPARSATEILSGDQDFGVSIGRLVQDEIGPLLAVVVVTAFEEQGLAEAGTLDRLQELLGNDHVGVDIGHSERHGNAGQFLELLHRVSSPSYH